MPAGWDLTGATCSNGDTPDSVYVGAGETVGCIFTNTKQGTITIVKDAVPADGRDFDFTLANDSFAEVFTLDDADPDDGDTYTDSKSFTLPSGDYNVTEVLPDGWALDGIQCQHGPDSFVGINYGENRAYITLAAGDDVVCAFANEKLGSITVVKDADPADDTPFDFTITGGIDDTFTLSDPSAISTTFERARPAATTGLPNCCLPAGTSMASSVNTDPIASWASTTVQTGPTSPWQQATMSSAPSPTPTRARSPS